MQEIWGARIGRYCGRIYENEQEGTVGDYQDKFGDIRVRMERFMPELGENYFLFGFIGGLMDEIKLMVGMMRPTTLTDAFEITRL